MDSSILEFGFVHWYKLGMLALAVNIRIKTRMANSVDPDEMAHNEPSHLDLHSLQRTPSRSTGLKG